MLCWLTYPAVPGTTIMAQIPCLHPASRYLLSIAGKEIPIPSGRWASSVRHTASNFWSSICRAVCSGPGKAGLSCYGAGGYSSEWEKALPCVWRWIGIGPQLAYSEDPGRPSFVLENGNTRYVAATHTVGDHRNDREQNWAGVIQIGALPQAKRWRVTDIWYGAKPAIPTTAELAAPGIGAGTFENKQMKVFRIEPTEYPDGDIPMRGFLRFGGSARDRQPATRGNCLSAIIRPYERSRHPCCWPLHGRYW